MRRTICTIALLLVLPRLIWADDRPLIAYSLRAAEKAVQTSTTENALAEALGGMTRLTGLVYDHGRNDIILIGRIEDDRPPLHLSEFVTALRAVLVLQQWPLVSIDPTPETSKTGKQNVRFEGGIAGSSFGKALLDADVALKGIALGTLQMVGLPSFFDIRAELARTRTGGVQGSNQVWFCALEPLLEEREDVFAIRDLKIGVRTKPAGNETPTAASNDDAASDFARNLTNSFERLAQAVPEIQRLRGLFETVAIVEGIRAFHDADLEYWLRGFTVRGVETPVTFDYIVRRELIPTADGIRALEIGGGVDLRVLTMRIEDGDIAALRDGVFLSRPSADALTWRVPLADWSISEHRMDLPSLKPTDSNSGTPLDWHLLDNNPISPRAPAGANSGAKKNVNPPLSDPFRYVDSRDVTIVSPNTGQPVIVLPDPEGASEKPPQRQDPRNEIKRLLGDIQHNLPKPELKLEPIPPAGQYHVGADGLHYLNENSLEQPRPGFEQLFTGNSSRMCLAASCLGQPKQSSDGLRATPYAYGDLNPYSVHRYFEAGWTVSNGEKTVGSAFGDVKLLDGGRFAAKDWNGDGYQIHDSTGKQVSTTSYRDVQTLRNGYFAVPSNNGIGMMTVMGPDERPIRDVPAYDLNRYVENGGFEADVRQSVTSDKSVMPRQISPPAPVGGIKANIHVDLTDFGPAPGKGTNPTK